MFSCTDNLDHGFSIKVPKKITVNKNFQIEFINENNHVIDSMYLFVNSNQISFEKGDFNIKSNTKISTLGKNSIAALVFYENKVKKVAATIEVLSDIVPVKYAYRVIKTYPHNADAYTQGLEYHDGYLYETTGIRGKSTLTKMDLKTNEIVKKVKLSDRYFGEGMTILNNNIYWLTWQSRKGFIYNLETFQLLDEFYYYDSKEGWGLTNNKKEIIKSDGTHNIWFLGPKSLKEVRKIEVYTDKNKVSLLNELELIDGKIFANRWDTKKPIKSGIMIINPNSGAVEGFIDLGNLREEIGKNQKLDDDMVLNGIAYNPRTKRLFVTGKRWNKIFEIEVFKEESN